MVGGNGAALSATTSFDEKAADQDLEPIAELLQRTAAELQTWAKMVSTIEDTMGSVVVSAEDPGAVEALQHIDVLGQSIVELAKFMESLAGSTSKEWLIHCAPLVQSLRLSSLAARLKACEKGVLLQNDASGEFESLE